MQIKIECIRVMKILMKVCTPQMVIDILLPELSQKNAKIREDVVNFVIVALLKFPSQEFDLLQVCSAISPSLIHAKRRVRQSAFECMATIHQVGQITYINQIQGVLLLARLPLALFSLYRRKLVPQCYEKNLDGLMFVVGFLGFSLFDNH